MGPAALVACTASAIPAEAPTAVLYPAVAVAAEGDREQAGDLIRQARGADLVQVSAWISELAEIGQHHRSVLQFIPELTGRADPPAPRSQEIP